MAEWSMAVVLKTTALGSYQNAIVAPYPAVGNVARSAA
jgi:hypothetical protein